EVRARRAAHVRCRQRRFRAQGDGRRARVLHRRRAAGVVYRQPGLGLGHVLHARGHAYSALAIFRRQLRLDRQRHSSGSPDMHRTPLRAALIAVALLFATAHAASLRWSSQGDLSTLDPHANNESFLNSQMNMVYDTLTRRGKDYTMKPWLA